MKEASSWFVAIQQSASQMLAGVVSYLPSLVAAVLILIAGWLLGRLARLAVRRVSGDANRLLDRLFQRGALSSARLSPATVAVLGEIVFWVVVFLAVTIAARVAGFEVISSWLNRIVTQLPNLIIGAAIVVIGYFISVVAGEQVAAAAQSARAGQSVLMGRLAQAAIFVTTLIIGLDQIGIDVTFLVVLFAAAVGAVFLGFSVAFGLGAQTHVSNLIGARYARRDLTPGLSIRIGNIEGDVLEVTSTHIALDTAEGRLLVPARRMNENEIAVVTPQKEEGKPDE